MGGMASLPAASGERSSRARIKEACRELADSGRPIVIKQVAAALGMKPKAVQGCIYRMRDVGEFTYRIGRAEPMYRAVVGGALRVISGRERLTYEAIGLEIGFTAQRVKALAKQASKAGEWPFKVRPIPVPTPGQVSRRERRERRRESALAAARARTEEQEAREMETPPELAERIDRFTAELRSKSVEGMIDGRREMDETPGGVAATSGKDHAEWSRVSRRFCEATRQEWDRPRHRASDHRGRMF